MSDDQISAKVWTFVESLGRGDTAHHNYVSVAGWPAMVSLSRSDSVDGPGWRVVVRDSDIAQPPSDAMDRQFSARLLAVDLANALSREHMDCLRVGHCPCPEAHAIDMCDCDCVCRYPAEHSLLVRNDIEATIRGLLELHAMASVQV